MDGVAIVEDEVRELIRRRGVDPHRDPAGIRRLVEAAVADYDDRSLSGSENVRSRSMAPALPNCAAPSPSMK